MTKLSRILVPGEEMHPDTPRRPLDVQRPHIGAVWMRVRALLGIVILALALLWPAAINGGPFWFPDTSTYVRAGDAATIVATGVPSEWSDRVRVGREGPTATEARSESISSRRELLEPTRPVLSGRSIYYGLLISLPMRAAGPWGAILLQAHLVAAILIGFGWVALRTDLVKRLRWLLVALAVCVVFSPLPFYTSMLMPDIYAGLGILAMTLAIVAWDRQTRLERASLIAIAGVIATFHSTHALLMLIMGIIAVLFRSDAGPRWRPIAVMLPILAMAWAGSAAFSFAIEKSLHQKPISPPFLQARLISAGPGTAYLREACAQDRSAWATCPFLSKFPVESDAFLWQQDPRTIVFQALNGDQQRQMAQEDKRFAIAVLRDDPVGVLTVTLASGLEQLFSFDYMNFNFTDARLRSIPNKYPHSVERHLVETRAVQRTMPTAVPLVASIVVTLGSLAAITWFVFRSQGRGSDRRRLSAIVLIVLTILANALVCGGMSGPHARYQMRLIWLLPLAVVIAGTNFGRGARREHDTRGVGDAT